jgi:hypothetical protein
LLQLRDVHERQQASGAGLSILELRGNGAVNDKKVESKEGEEGQEGASTD